MNRFFSSAALAVVIAVSCSAANAATYIYTGAGYTSVHYDDGGYSALPENANAVAFNNYGSFELGSAINIFLELPFELAVSKTTQFFLSVYDPLRVDIQMEVDRFDLTPEKWSISDGKGLGLFGHGYDVRFSLTTDSAGSITAWEIQGYGGSGADETSLTSSGAVGDSAGYYWEWGFRLEDDPSGEFYYRAEESSASTSEIGSWTVLRNDVSPVPLPAGLPLIVAGLSALGFLRLWRKSAAMGQASG